MLKLVNMKNIGIVIEYNPLHNGHINHIRTIKKLHPNSLIIAAMSGNVVQRGEFAVVSKFERTIEALKNLVDIVIEIPSFYVLNNANIFASKAIEILNDFKVEKIIFGSESNDIFKINEKANLIGNIGEADFKESWHKNYSMPKVLEDLANLDFKSNDILGICYVIEGRKINPQLEFGTIKRLKNETHTSAYDLRKKMQNDESIEQFVPKNWIEARQVQKINTQEFVPFFKYDLITKKTIKNEVNFLRNKIMDELEVDLFGLSSKNFTKAALKRENMKFSLELEETVYTTWRVLGASEIGMKFLKENKDINYSTKYLPIYENELKIARVISLIYGKQHIIDEINYNPQFIKTKL